MVKITSKKIFVGFLSSALLFLSSCASSISTKVQRPAELNLNGAKTIAVLPFQTRELESSGNINILGLINFSFNSKQQNSKNDIAAYLTDSLTSQLLNSSYFTVISSAKVEKALENSLEIPCDVYLTGYITKFDERINTSYSKEEKKDFYTRSFSFTVVYQVIDAHTDKIIAYKSKDFSDSSYKTSKRSEVPTSFEMVRSKIDSLVSQILRELQPYEITKYLTLLDDKEKSENMKKAKEFAKNGDLVRAYEEYQDLYDLDYIFEAGYNAAIILEALGRYAQAEKLADELYDSTGDKRAYSLLKDIRREIELAETLKNQMNQRQ